MSTSHVQLRFNGQLAVAQVSGRNSDSFDRVVTRVELTIDSGSPAPSDVQIQLRLDGSTQAQVFTLTAGLLYSTTDVSGNGLSVSANVVLDAIVAAAGDAADVSVRLTIESGAELPSGADVDCYLGMLSDIKSHVLSLSLQSGTDYDTLLTTIGRGVALWFDRHCNRKFKRLAGATQDFDAPRDHVILERYPVESVASVSMKTSDAEGFVAASGLNLNVKNDAGILQFGCFYGISYAVIRVTYTGGYWYDDSVDQTGSLPSGATALPSDVKFAWLQQVAHTFAVADRLGVGIGAKPGEWANLQDSELLPAVREILQPYRRMAIV